MHVEIILLTFYFVSLIFMIWNMKIETDHKLWSESLDAWGNRLDAFILEKAVYETDLNKFSDDCSVYELMSNRYSQIVGRSTTVFGMKLT